MKISLYRFFVTTQLGAKRVLGQLDVHRVNGGGVLRHRFPRE